MPGANLFSKVGFPLLVACAAILFGWTQGSAQAPSPEQLEEGARLYAENCAVCHGPNGEGRVGATLAKDWPAIRPDMTVRNVIVNGVSGSPMPAWSIEKGGPLSEAQINDIVAYVVSLPKMKPPIEAPPAGSAEEPPQAPAWLLGVIGLGLFFLALMVVLGAILFFQRRA